MVNVFCWTSWKGIFSVKLDKVDDIEYIPFREEIHKPNYSQGVINAYRNIQSKEQAG